MDITDVTGEFYTQIGCILNEHIATKYILK